ncbi:hypothetical protein PL11201_660079 [Planktothrix sp. PCC 11201]|nr:hypothetical protein PL11201_660079 [Planktothrix sp. PCC 11201]
MFYLVTTSKEKLDPFNATMYYYKIHFVSSNLFFQQTGC